MTMRYTPQCEGRYVIVTTPMALLLVDLVNLEQITLHQGHDTYSGFTASPTHFYVAIFDRMHVEYFQGRPSASKILVFDYNFNFVEYIYPDFPFHDVHEILWHQGKLYAINSGYDMLAIYDGNTWEKWYPYGEPQGDKQDVHHFNSISIYDNKIYISAHNYGPSFVAAFSLDTKDKIDEITIGNCTHTIWFENSEMYVCSSNESTIISDKGFLKHTAEWPRGVAICKDSTIVGCSAFGAYKINNTYHNAHIYTYDKSWKQKGLIVLKGQLQVSDIFPIEQCLEPAVFFNDNRFQKQALLGLSTSVPITKNEELLLDLYTVNAIRVGRMIQDLRKFSTLEARLSKRLDYLERHTFKGRLRKLKKFIKTILHQIGIGEKP